jgi:hypothetical protein
VFQLQHFLHTCGNSVADAQFVLLSLLKLPALPPEILQFMAIFILSSIYGTIVGLVWSLALATDLSKGLLTGAAIGAFFGLIAAMFAYLARLRGRLTEKEIPYFGAVY